MTKVELIAAVAANAGLTKKDADKAVSATLDVTAPICCGSGFWARSFPLRRRRYRQDRRSSVPDVPTEAYSPY